MVQRCVCDAFLPIAFFALGWRTRSSWHNPLNRRRRSCVRRTSRRGRAPRALPRAPSTSPTRARSSRRWTTQNSAGRGPAGLASTAGTASSRRCVASTTRIRIRLMLHTLTISPSQIFLLGGGRSALTEGIFRAVRLVVAEDAVVVLLVGGALTRCVAVVAQQVAVTGRFAATVRGVACSPVFASAIVGGVLTVAFAALVVVTGARARTGAAALLCKSLRWQTMASYYSFEAKK